MRGPNFNIAAQKFVDANKDKWKSQGTHVGDIEDFQVIHDGVFYSVWDNDTIVACSSLSNNEVDHVWVNPQYRGRRVFSMLLWFYKTRLNQSPLVLGQVHSSDMSEVVKGLSRFHKFWFNTRTNEKVPFSIDTMNDYYSYHEVTPWRLILENSGDFTGWSMYNTRTSFIYESYSPYID